MARIDDYLEARRIAVDVLNARALDAICNRSGCDSPDGQSLNVPFLDRRYRVGYPDFPFDDRDDPERAVPIQEQVLILHYLMGAGAPSPSGQWIAYREIPGAAFYYSAFVKRAIDPLKKGFGGRPERLSALAPRIGGQAVEAGDVGFEFLPLPKVPLQMVLYAGDDEFPPEAGILFDRSVDGYLSPEDAAWMAGMVVYRLMALDR
ncbi:MAG: DUF3786 domain-containing protein [Desulfobacterales bacterium]|jgi:hypothetical protein